jgi:hypothetical protein
MFYKFLLVSCWIDCHSQDFSSRDLSICLSFCSVSISSSLKPVISFPSWFSASMRWRKEQVFPRKSPIDWAFFTYEGNRSATPVAGTGEGGCRSSWRSPTLPSTEWRTSIQGCASLSSSTWQTRVWAVCRNEHVLTQSAPWNLLEGGHVTMHHHRRSLIEPGTPVCHTEGCQGLWGQLKLPQEE